MVDSPQEQEAFRVLDAYMERLCAGEQPDRDANALDAGDQAVATGDGSGRIGKASPYPGCTPHEV